MQLEDYFDFQRRDDIRIKGHRIGIETVLDAYLHCGMTAEQIQETYPTLTLEEVYATILYYLHNREQVDSYMAEWIAYCDRSEAEAGQNPSSVAQRLLAAQEELSAYPPEERRTMMRTILAKQKALPAPSRESREVA